jgi:CheY-like chemotaxis protein
MDRQQLTKVLIVEDEIISAMDIEQSLKDLGYEMVESASSGQVAIEKAAYMAPDLVLMDIKLSGSMDGVEAAKRIQARFDIPVIYLTAHSDNETLQRAKLSEPYGYILKPFTEQELRIAIEMALYRHKMEKWRGMKRDQ